MDALVEYGGETVRFCNVNPVDYVEGMLLRGSWYELPNLEFIRGLQVIGNYVDVGAYVGTHSLFFSLFCPSQQVYSFEPQPKVYSKLLDNLAANGVTNCQVFNFAVGKSRGLADVREAADTNKGGTRVVSSLGGVTDIVPIDSLHLPKISLMKIDVEGAELDVLQGALSTLGGVSHLFIELWPEWKCVERRVPHSTPEVIELLATLGFELRQTLAEDLIHFSKR